MNVERDATRPAEGRVITPADLIAINAALHGGTAQVRDTGLVASAAARPATFTFGAEVFPTVEEKAAALLHSVLGNHPFGNALVLSFVDDLDERVAEIARRGIEPAKRETYGNGVTKVTYRDVEGNEISFGGGPG